MGQSGAFITCEPACPTWPPYLVLCHPKFSFVPELKAGAGGGLCIECYLNGIFDSAGNHRLLIGTIKTVCDDRDTAIIMGSLTGALLYYGEAYRKNNSAAGFTFAHQVDSPALAELGIERLPAFRDEMAVVEIGGFRRSQQFLDLFNDWDRERAQLWLEQNFPPEKLSLE